MTKMLTNDQITKALIDWHDDFVAGNWDGVQTPDQMLAEWANTKHAEVHSNGDLYIEDPCVGHYLGVDVARAFVNWLVDRQAIADVTE